MDLNVKSVFQCVQKSVHSSQTTASAKASTSRPANTQPARFAPLLAACATSDSPSRVIATASVAGIGIGSTGANSVPAYSASKAAVIHLMNHLAIELGPKHILCNSIAPGFFPTRMANGLMEAMGGPEALASKNPTGRLGKPEDIAGLVVFLASRASGHVNGATVPVDGGQLWQRSQL